MHDAAWCPQMMRWSVLLLVLVVGACESTAKPGADGGGGSNAGGTTGGGGHGGSAGSAGGQSGGGGTTGCAANQVWCPGCEPGSGACYSGGCPGVACPPPDGGAGASGSGGTSGSGGAGGRGGSGGNAGHGGSGGGTGGTGGVKACGTHLCTTGEICVHPSCGGIALPCVPLPDGGQCPSGYTYSSFCATFGSTPGSGPGCQPPPCTPPAPYCLAVPASCGTSVTCSCLPANVCQGGGACVLVSGGEVLCLSA